MKTLVIFLNELSLRTQIPAEEMLPHALATLSAARSARGIRTDIVVASHAPIGSLVFGYQYTNLAAILRGDAHKEEWRFLRALEQSSPWDAYPGLLVPGDLREVVCRGETAVGMLWATQNGTLVLSFGFSPEWTTDHLDAELRQMDASGNIAPTAISIANLCNPNQATVHRALIANYGHTTLGSSLIHEGEGFVIRIWFNEHPPPHFHVLSRRDTSESIARCSIETLDFISGNPLPAIRRRVTDWARTRTKELMEAWNHCSAGRHPPHIE